MILKIILVLISLMRPVPLSTIEQVEKIVTAYCGCEKCCGSYADGITASGYKLREGSKVVAAPKNIPFGTKIYIPGYGLATVEDRGGSIKGNRLDVYFQTHKEALEWGRRIVIVERGDKEMKSFNELLNIWDSLNHPSVVNREAGFKMLALKKGYSLKVVRTFIIRFVRGFFYSV